jgi:putative Holliday junction resolvase
MRILGIDLGEKRVGIALSDPTGSIASPLCVLDRSGIGDEDLARAIASIARERGAEVIVVGLPLNMDGSIGDSAKKAISFAGVLEDIAGIRVQLWDERLSTEAVKRAMIRAGIRKGKRKKAIDGAAAAFILQGYLDRRRWSDWGSEED